MSKIKLCYDFASKKKINIEEDNEKRFLKVLDSVDCVVLYDKKRLPFNDMSQLSVVEMWKTKTLCVGYDPSCLKEFSVIDFNIEDISYFYVTGEASYFVEQVDDYGNSETRRVTTGFTISTHGDKRVLYLRKEDKFKNPF